MTDRLAAVAYRLLAPRATGGSAPASGDDLMNLDTSPLPNGAMCHVGTAAGGGTLMRFDRAGTGVAASYADGAPLLVVPNSGPGRWNAIEGEAVDRLSFNVDADVFNTTILTSGADEWSVFPDCSPVFSGSPLIASIFTLTGAGAILTYNGPTRKFKFSQVLTCDNATGANADTMGLSFSVNGATIGSTTALTSMGQIQQGTDQLQRQIQHEAVLSLGPAATLQPIFRSLVGDDYVIRRWHVSVTPSEA